MQAKDIPLGLLLSRILKNYVGVFSRELTHLPISRYHYILVMISENEGINQQGLADGLGTDKVTMGRMLDYLSEQGCIERSQNPEDRREHLIHLTEKGKNILPEIQDAVKKSNKILFKGIDYKSKLEFYKLLNKMSNNLQNLPKENFHIHFSKET